MRLIRGSAAVFLLCLFHEKVSIFVAYKLFFSFFFQAFTECLRVLKPQATLAMTTWGTDIAFLSYFGNVRRRLLDQGDFSFTLRTHAHTIVPSTHARTRTHGLYPHINFLSCYLQRAWVRTACTGRTCTCIPSTHTHTHAHT